MNILNTKGVDLTTPSQKIIAGIIMVAVFLGLWFLLPPLVVIMQNLILLIIYGALLTPVIMMLVFQPFVVWGFFKNLTWIITKKMIGADLLGTMDRYLEHLETKHNRLCASRDKVSGVEKLLQRQLSETTNKVSKAKSDYLVLEQNGAKESDLKRISNKLSVDTSIMESLIPRYESVRNQREYLDKLAELWFADIESLGYMIEGKKQEYETYKKTAEAMGEAKEFVNGSSAEGKVFQESLKQLEQNVTMYMANIESFEAKAKPLIEQGANNQILVEEDGKKIIEEYKRLQSFTN